ncbi:MAG: 50S ribosomal protein L10 [Polyangiales bacterium]
MNEARLAEKEAQVADLRANFDKAVAAVLVDFRGVGVLAITDLRQRFRAAGVEYRVVKNNLVKRALAGSSWAEAVEFQAQLKGPTGVAWSYEDPSAAAKVIKAFRKEGEANEKLSVKCGVLDGTVLSSARVESELASMPGKDELRAQLLAQMLAPAQSMVRQLNAPAQSLVYVLQARAQQLESQ